MRGVGPAGAMMGAIVVERSPISQRHRRAQHYFSAMIASMRLTRFASWYTLRAWSPAQASRVGAQALLEHRRYRHGNDHAEHAECVVAGDHRAEQERRVEVDRCQAILTCAEVMYRR